MPKVTNAFTTYGAQANREDLSDIIYNIDPADTPFVTLAGRRNVTNKTFDWQTEALPNVDKANAQVEGFVNANSASTPTVRISNVVQISKRDATVSGSQEAANPAGKRSEMSHQMAICGKALKRDMESILSGEQARNDGEDTTPTARKTRGLEHWITTNVSYGAGGANPASATAVLTDGTKRRFTEALLGNSMQVAWTNGAEPNVLLMGPYSKRVFSTFAGRAASRVRVDQDSIVAAADFYLSDFGELKALPSRFSRARTVFGLDPDYVSVGYYRRFVRIPIAKTGDATTEVILSEYGLEMKNEKAHFKISDLFESAGEDTLPASLAGAVGPIDTSGGSDVLA